MLIWLIKKKKKSKDVIITKVRIMVPDEGGKGTRIEMGHMERFLAGVCGKLLILDSDDSYKSVCLIIIHCAIHCCVWFTNSIFNNKRFLFFYVVLSGVFLLTLTLIAAQEVGF